MALSQTDTFETTIEIGGAVNTMTFTMVVIKDQVSEYRINDIVIPASRFHRLVTAYTESQAIATANGYTTPSND